MNISRFVIYSQRWGLYGLLLILASCAPPAASSPTPTLANVCSAKGLPFQPPYLEVRTVDQLFALASPATSLPAEPTTFTLTCTVFEGQACHWEQSERDVAEQWLKDKELVKQIIQELNAENVEDAHSVKGTMQSLTIRCTTAPPGAELPLCEAHRTDKWEGLPVCP